MKFNEILARIAGVIFFFQGLWYTFVGGSAAAIDDIVAASIITLAGTISLIAGIFFLCIKSD